MYCGGDSVASGSVDPALTCPGCGGAMSKDDTEGLVIDVCTVCHGSWYDRGELEKIVEARKAERPATNPTSKPAVERFEIDQTRPEYRNCPRCKQQMQRKNFERFSGVIVDSCHAHGIFLDAGEIDRVVSFVASGGKKMAATEIAKESKREADREEQFDRVLSRVRFPVRSSAMYGHPSYVEGTLVTAALTDLLSINWKDD